MKSKGRDFQIKENMVQLYTVYRRCFLNKLNIELPHDPAIPPQVRTQANWKFVSTQKFLHKHSHVWFHNNQIAETTQMSIKWWTDKQMWYIHLMKSYSATKRNKILMHASKWMNFKNMLSKISQLDRATDCMIPCIRNIQNRQIHWDSKQINCCQGLGGRVRRGSYYLMGTIFLLEEIKMFWN